MKKKVLSQLKRKLIQGKVYRRSDLAHFSTNIDRHLKALVIEGPLIKLQNGLYYYPKNSSFGDVPPEENKLVKSFLKTSKFLVYSPNLFNSLGLGTTQLYNLPVVLNQKRHGKLKLGSRTFYFQRRINIPKQMTKDLLLVELLNNLKMVLEEKKTLLKALTQKLHDFDKNHLQKTAKRYGNYSTQKRLNSLLKKPFAHAA